MADKYNVTRTIIPALPGWFVVYFDEHDLVCFDVPIIAWSIEHHTRITVSKAPDYSYYNVLPLTADGDGEEGHPYVAIKRSDGKYEIVFGQTFDNEHELTQYWTEQHKKREAAEA